MKLKGNDNNKLKWYVIHTMSNQENKVKASLERTINSLNLHDDISNVLIPTIKKVVEFKNGQKKTIDYKLYPGYIFIEMKLSYDSWYVVRNITGVTGFVGIGSIPEPLTSSEINRILKQTESREIIDTHLKWKKGESVQVLSGPFRELVGKIIDMNKEKGKLKILLSLFDRETPVEVSFDQVQKI